MYFIVVGLKSEILAAADQLNAIPVKKEIYLIDKYNRVKILKGNPYNNLNNFILSDKNLSRFLETSQYIIIAFKNKKFVLNIIKKWIEFHNSGIILLTFIVEANLIKKIKNWLNKKGKEIEIVILPVLPYKKSINNFLLIAGDFNARFTKQLRKEISKNNISQFYLNYKEIESIVMVFQAVNIINNALIIELGQLTKRINVDIEIIKKGLMLLTNFQKDNHIIDINKNELGKKGISNLELIFTAQNIIKNNEKWILSEIINLMNIYSITKIGIIGTKTIGTILKLIRFPIKIIKIFSTEKVKKVISPKIEYVSNPYQAIEGVDLLLILSNENLFNSLSLQRLEKIINNKLIIDQTNLFDIEEIKATNWCYISKGRIVCMKN